MEKEEEAEVSKAATIVNTRVVTAAKLPVVLAKPKLSITLLIGLVGGLFVSIAAVIAQRSFSSRFQTDEEIRRAASVPVFGIVPRRSRKETAGSIIASRPQSPFVEAFRMLRAKLYNSFSDQESRVILITSAASADGKTTIASNFAKILAEDGKRVVVVDGDLHRGHIHEALKIEQAPGLAEWVVTKTKPRLKTVTGESFVVLPSGLFPPNPSELLNNDFFDQIIATLRNEFDFVILDGPPLPLVTDSMILAKHADLILSVVNVEHTPRGSFEVHNETLSKLGRRHAMIINGVQASEYGYGDQRNSVTRTIIDRSPKVVVSFLKWL
jgi:capsular exopolysaccharide synthesis family protein